MVTLKQEERKKILFAVWLINEIARSWKTGGTSVYHTLQRDNIVNRYILKCYDVLHTMGSKALVDDVTEIAEERGLLD